MPKMLADARTRLYALTTLPANLESITLTQVNAGVRVDKRINKGDYRLSPTASDTVNENEMGNRGNGTAFSAENYEGSITPFLYYDTDGKLDEESQDVWDLVREKGATFWLVEREGPESDQAWAVGDEYEVYEVINDTPQKQSDRFAGYIKRIVPLGIQGRWTGSIATA